MSINSISKLNPEHLVEVGHLISSWEKVRLHGFYWTLIEIAQELKLSEGYGYFSPQLQAMIIFRELDCEAEVIMVLQRKDFRGSARFLLRELINAKSNLRQWWLEVHEKNTSALKLYLDLGFSVIHRRKFYYRDRGDALILTYKKN